GIPKLGSKELRPLGISPVVNRVVEMAVRQVIEPIFEQTFAEQSYGFRPGRGAKDALRRVQQLLDGGQVWIVDADVKGYFDNIPQDKLLAAVEEHVSDGAVLELLRRALKQGVMESGKGWQPTETGTPQGAVISPLLANIYLNALDHLMAKLNRRLQHDPAFQWLAGLEVINYHTLWDFRAAFDKELTELFTNSLGVMSAEGLVSLERVMHDGTKVRACAGADSFRREQTLQKHLEAAREQVEAMGDPRADESARQRAARQRAARERQERLERAVEELAKICQTKNDAQEKESARV